MPSSLVHPTGVVKPANGAATTVGTLNQQAETAVDHNLHHTTAFPHDDDVSSDPSLKEVRCEGDR